MPTPKACPVCSNQTLEPIMRKLLSTSDENVNGIVSGILAYRCENGHIFMVLDEEQSLRKGAGE